MTYQAEQPIFDEQPVSNIEITIGIEDVPKPWWKTLYFALQITLVDFTPFMWTAGFAALCFLCALLWVLRLAAKRMLRFWLVFAKCSYYSINYS